MVATPLVEASELEDFPGSPFPAWVVATAAGNVRLIAGWHIAPKVTETLTVDSPGGRTLLLPTMHLLQVAAVRDMTTDEPRALTGWRFSRAGILSGCSFPRGLSAVEVDVVHGYDTCPPELLPVIAAECQASARERAVRTQTDGPFSRSYTPVGLDADPTLARYTVPSRP